MPPRHARPQSAALSSVEVFTGVGAAKHRTQDVGYEALDVDHSVARHRFCEGGREGKGGKHRFVFSFMKTDFCN